MWKPLDVVPEHRTRATVVWGALLLAIVGYTALQIAALKSKFDNPSTSFSVSGDLYALPPLEICFWPGMGCDGMFSVDKCGAEASANVFVSGRPTGQNVEFESTYSNCRGFNLADLGIQGVEDEDNDNRPQMRPFTTVVMSWGIDPSNEEPYTDVVSVFLGTGSTAEQVDVPYTRVVQSTGCGSGRADFIQTHMTIGKNIRTFISGDSETSYRALTISTSNFVDPAIFSNNTNDNISTFSRGHLHLTLTQGAFSLTELSDINPLDIGTLLGNIGGFWELLLVTWAILFFSSKSESPTQRARDFTQIFHRGKNMVCSRRCSITQTVVPNANSNGGEQPYRIAARKGQQGFPGLTSIRIITPVGAPAPLKRAASYFRHPTGNDYPVRPAASVTRSVDDREGSVESDGSTQATGRSWQPSDRV